jgi:hypothetical protein
LTMPLLTLMALIVSTNIFLLFMRTIPMSMSMSMSMSILPNNIKIKTAPY